MYRQMNVRNGYYRNNLRNNIPFNQTRSMPSITSQVLGKAISVPKPMGLAKSLVTSSISNGSKLGLGGIIGGLNKTLTTVNQAMPLINQVKPLFGNFKSVINVVKGFRNKNTNTPKVEPKKTVNNTNNTTSNTTNSNEYIQENYQFTPNKPYFS